MRQPNHLTDGWIYRTLLVLLLPAVLTSCGGGGGLGADGGVSGSGLSSVTGNVTEIAGANDDVGGIRVLVQGTDVETLTDDDGSFTLTGEFDGPVTVVFELDDGGRAETMVEVPTGGNVDLEDITVDPEEEEARPTRQIVTFSGVVQEADCAADTLLVVAGDDAQQTRFSVRLDDAFVHDAAGAPIACADIRPRDEARVQGEVLEDDRIGNADVEIRRQEPTRTPTPRPVATSTNAPAPGRTLDAPRATTTPAIDVRPIPTETRPAVDRPRPTPTATPSDAPRPAPLATARIAPQPAPRP